jgi:hypothetical protein
VDDGGVPKTNVDGRGTDDTLEGAIERSEAVFLRLRRARLHVWFVDLHDIGSGCEEIANLRVHGVGVCQRGVSLMVVEIILCLL